MKIRLAHSSAENYRNAYEPLDRSCVDAHLQSYVTDEALKKYNSALPGREEIEQYVELMRVFEMIRKGGVAFSLQVSNDGTAKATDVRVYVDFPDEFAIFELDDVCDISEPTAPRLPKNPIDEAERKYEEAMNPALAAAWKLNESLYGENLSGGHGALPILPINAYDRSESLHQSHLIAGNSITMESTQIPHRDLNIFDGIYVVPKCRGKFQIKVTLMCSEYIEPDEKYIDIEVV